MTVVIDELGEGHAVLMVRTNQGDYVLDNKTSSILPWHRTGYVYIKRESQDTIGWVSLGGIVVVADHHREPLKQNRRQAPVNPSIHEVRRISRSASIFWAKCFQFST